MSSIINKLIQIRNYQSAWYYLEHPILLLKNKLIVLSLIVKKNLGKDINFKSDIKSDIPIDIVICAIEKDYDVLVHVIDSIRQYIKHPLGSIYIISPLSERIETICKQKDCMLLDENKVLPITKKDINYTVGNVDRSGWLFQQLLKWGADKFVYNEYFLVTEADTVFCRPRVFINNKKIIFPVSSYLCHIPYFRIIYRLIGLRVLPIINLTSHHALYNKTILHKLKGDIEKYCKVKWYEAIIDRIDKNEGSSVSDYESYAQYVLSKYPNSCELEYWYNLHFGRKRLHNIKNLIKRFGKNYKSISFHSYNE